MTKDNALFILGEMPEWNPDSRYSYEEYEEVIELCRALLVVSDNENGSDFISREAVIDLLNQYGYYDKEMKRDLSAIPSVVPERETLEKIRTDMMSYRDSVDRAISEDEFKRDGMKIAYQDCIEIIDKYMVGRENGECISVPFDFDLFQAGLMDIPKGMTNGDVLITFYPNLKYTIRNGRVVTTIGVASSFDLDWWNTPYKKGGKEC